MTLNMPLMAPAALMSKVAILGKNQEWTWGHVHRASIELADRLCGADAIYNLCGSQLGFVIAMLASLRCGCLQLLPPSRGNSDLIASLEPSINTIIVVDDERLLQAEWLKHNHCLVFEPKASLGVLRDIDLTWILNWDLPLIRLYTSGSTGNPEPKLKTLKQLVQGAQSLSSRIDQELKGGFSKLNYMVSSVAPQHMFGLEVSVMLALVYGLPVLDRRPLLPADVRAALDIGRHNAVWITTPVHIVALSRSGESLPNCNIVIASTMPLAITQAAWIEKQAGIPVLEIYGSTETGALATRRTASESHWSPLPGVKIESNQNGAVVWGTHFESPQRLNDQIVLGQDNRFSLLGRKTDLIKIAGRRASLAGLNSLLQEVPGISEAVFYLPELDNQRERLVVIYVGEDSAPRNIKSYLRDRIDSTFMPRAFIRVKLLPRNEEGKLPKQSLEKIYQTWASERI